MVRPSVSAELFGRSQCVTRGGGERKRERGGWRPYSGRVHDQFTLVSCLERLEQNLMLVGLAVSWIETP